MLAGVEASCRGTISAHYLPCTAGNEMLHKIMVSWQAHDLSLKSQPFDSLTVSLLLATR